MSIDAAQKIVEILDSKIVEHVLGNLLRSDYKTSLLDAKKLHSYKLDN